MFTTLESIFSRPEPFSVCTTEDLWTDEHTSERMLEFHLDGITDLSSRNFRFIDNSVDWIVSRFFTGEDTSVIDFGCGPGMYTSRFARYGAKVTGVDFSKRSIQYARDMAEKEHLAVDYICQDYLKFQTDKHFDLITMIFCDFCALGPANRKVMLDKFASLLNTGGRILLDVCSIAAFDERTESSTCARNLMDGFWSKEDYFGFLNTMKYPDEKVTLEKYTIIEPGRTRTVYNWLQYFNPETLREELDLCNLSIQEVFDDVSGTPYTPTHHEFAIIAAHK
jgi:cyclopropane fatty-acyl-phospholipid synthase-like methyltransferase